MKRLRLAVVGAPVSGKTYLLFDLIHALRAMGCQAERLPLDYPYSSFGTFFYEISNFATDGDEQRRRQSLRGTEAYACRQENHYGGVFKTPNGQRLEIDFVNIPGEIFEDHSTEDRQGAQERMNAYFDVCNALADEQLKKAFRAVTYKSGTGHRVTLIEPSDIACQTLGITHSTAPGQPASARYANYMEWGEIYRELHDLGYERGGEKTVSGRHVIEHFGDYLPDSTLLSIQDLWRLFGARCEVKVGAFKTEVAPYFYFYDYCRKATDIILCDRLFLPGHRMDYAFNWVEMINALARYYNRPGTGRGPEVHMAFRGADMLVSSPETQACLRRVADAAAPAAQPGQPEDPKAGALRRDAAYNAFIDTLLSRLYGSMRGGNVAEPDRERVARAVPQAVDEEAEKRPTAIAPNLAQHINARCGTDAAGGFWKLFTLAYRPPSLLTRLVLWLTGEPPLPTLRQMQQARTVLPPNVYFTATPIDGHFRIYANDRDDPTTFGCTAPDGHLKSFHMELTRYGETSFCFGTFQLLRNILQR